MAACPPSKAVRLSSLQAQQAEVCAPSPISLSRPMGKGMTSFSLMCCNFPGNVSDPRRDLNRRSHSAGCTMDFSWRDNDSQGGLSRNWWSAARPGPPWVQYGGGHPGLGNSWWGRTRREVGSDRVGEDPLAPWFLLN